VTLSLKAKTAALAVLVASYMGTHDVIAGDLGLALLVVAVFASWRFVDGFWPIVGSGLVGGAVAGLLILGPGFRLAMRAAAIMDPAHPEEFTIGGTLFIVVGIGAILGGVRGATAHLARRAFGIRSAILAGALLATVEMATLALFSGDLSRELFEIGFGAWVNIPLFGLFALGYGIAAMAVADRAEAAIHHRTGRRREEVPA
jgi:hypothetical protein